MRPRHVITPARRVAGKARQAGFAGLTLRLYDPATQQWSLYWASKRTGTLFPPVTGAFTDGVGEFYGDDTHNDVPVDLTRRP